MPYSHDMCPCDFCFPDKGDANHNGACYSNCKHQFVSCPIIETSMPTDVDEGKDDSFKILQQPADLLTVTKFYTEKSIEFMQNSIAADKPFFLYMAYHQTHHPIFAGMNKNNSHKFIKT